MKKIIILVIAVLCFSGRTFTQTADNSKAIKYRRSSLHTILVESDKFPYKDTVIKSYYDAPFPDKYNDHTIGERTFDPKKYPLTAEEKALLGKKIKIKLNPALDSLDPSAKELPLIIEKYLKEAKIANKIVAKWFDRQDDGSFNMGLIQERGSYNASEMEANISKVSARGTSSLADAGIELIGNTFVVVNKFNFVSNEIYARITRDIAKLIASRIPNAIAQKVAITGADVLYEQTKDGYSVLAKSYLYKLKWNDSTEAVFYNDLWMDKTNADPKKKEAFDNSNLFQLEFVGAENAMGMVMFSAPGKEDKVIKKATIRTIDAVYAKLQKEYDVFMPKVPLYTGEPITAKIGMKEGLDGGEKFEVYEQTVDEKGLTKYVSKGIIKVDKKLIWDNRYNLAEEAPATAPAEGTADAKTAEKTNAKEKTDAKPVLDRTTFKGGKGYYPGMLIKQIK